jgi:hypothetical protein
MAVCLQALLPPFKAVLEGLANLKMEPTRRAVRAIMPLRRAAHLER